MSIKVTYRFTSRLSMRIVKNGDVHVSYYPRWREARQHTRSLLNSQ